MAGRFDRFISRLAGVELSDRAVNQYSRAAGDLRANAVRRRNLRLYLQQMAAIAPSTLLIGEAPSYRGGRLTGVAFVSETLLLDGVAISSTPCTILGSQQGFRKATGSTRLSTEASATMVWGTIRGIVPLPLLWNAFPFHPFHRGLPDSNRAPGRTELEIGQPFIEMLMRLFPIALVVAIGNHASSSLSKMRVAHTRVRHPSQGGKTRFVEGMRALSP